MDWIQSFFSTVIILLLREKLCHVILVNICDDILFSAETEQIFFALISNVF